MGELDDGTLLFGECKWSSSPVGLPVYYSLRDKIAGLPQKASSQNVRHMVFSLAGFDNDLVEAAQRENLILVSGDDGNDTGTLSGYAKQINTKHRDVVLQKQQGKRS